MPLIEIDVLTLFPDMINATFGESIIARAARRGHVAVRAHQIRDYTLQKQKQVDDYPYGGGLGLVMTADPLYRCLEHAKVSHGNGRVILMSPAGQTFTQHHARRLRDSYSHLILVCGHYEGIDERFVEECVDEEISLGDFVLTGGEIAACAVCDAVCRLVPGVLADETAFENESHYAGLLEHPQYTRPEVWHDRKVPEVLLSGNHKKIEEWRHDQSLKRTKERRPDMLQ